MSFQGNVSGNDLSKKSTGEEKKRGFVCSVFFFFFFPARIKLNILFFDLLIFHFSPNMKQIKISDMLVELLFLSYIIFI